MKGTSLRSLSGLPSPIPSGHSPSSSGIGRFYQRFKPARSSAGGAWVQATGLVFGVSLLPLLASQAPPGLPDTIVWLRLPESDLGQARQLYMQLREADHQKLTVVVAVPPPATGVGVALGDRLRRAAGLGLAWHATDEAPADGR